MAGSVYPLRVDEPTLRSATVRFLRSHSRNRMEIEKLYHFLRRNGIVDPNGKPAIMTADERERRMIYAWLIENTGQQNDS